MQYINDNTPNFQWTNKDNAFQLYIYIYDVENAYNQIFGDIVDNTAENYQVPDSDSLPDGIYAWQIVAYENPFDWVETDNYIFIVDTSPPQRPTIVYPDNGSIINCYMQQYITWPTVIDNGAVCYLLTLATDNGFNNPVSIKGIVYKNYETDENKFDLPELPTGTYYFRVAAKDEAGNISDNYEIWFYFDNRIPMFKTDENFIIARTRDNKDTRHETWLHYYFENDNIYILVKTTETGLTVWGNFPELGPKENAYGVPLSVNPMNYLITYENVQIENMMGYGITIFLQDNAGNINASYAFGVSFVAVMNINPRNMGIGLEGDTTDWTTIKDFTNVENLVFDRYLGADRLGTLRFLENLNLCDNTTMNALINLGNNLNIAMAEMSLNTAADALAAMNKKSELTMYNLDLLGFTAQPGILKDGVPVLQSGYTDNLASGIENLIWDNVLHQLSFSVSGWSAYTADGKLPLIENITVTKLSSTSVKINWQTDENATSVVEYGTDNTYGTTLSENTPVKDHSITITGLTAGTTYHFRVKSKDLVGLENASADSTFTTSVPVSGSTTATGYQVNIGSITPGAPVTAAVQNVPITQLEIAVDNTVSNVQITIEETTSPSGISIGPPGESLGYIEITTNISDDVIDYVLISFKVEKSKLVGIDKSLVSL
ncbi:MAG: fibronectin type III domain-containing protein, partial [Candidatus Hadarchaeum sp.]